VQQLLLAGIMQYAIIAIVARLCRAARGASAPPERDAVLALWHRYEQGDLTAQEFRRLRRGICRVTPDRPTAAAIEPRRATASS
jgi:hypothetical protein